MVRSSGGLSKNATEISRELAQKPMREDPMISIDYIGLDIHKKTISFCAKAQDGSIRDEGIIPGL